MRIPPAKNGNQPDAVVFDVDGTLYRQRGLRIRMLSELLFQSAFSRRGRLDLRILKRFREDRETLGSRIAEGFAEAQYRLTAQQLNLPAERVEEAVVRWIHERPLRHLRRYRTEKIAEWMDCLRGKGIRLGVYSEYPAEDKLAALGLQVDAMTCSTDPEVDAFKPDPKGLLVVLRMLGVDPSKALYVGDREDKDRPCAEAAGVAFMHVSEL